MIVGRSGMVVNVMEVMRNPDSVIDNGLSHICWVEVTCRGQRLLLFLAAALVWSLPWYGTRQVLFLSFGEDRGRSAGHDRCGDRWPAPAPVFQMLEEPDLVERLGHVMDSDDSCEIWPLVNSVSTSNARTVAVS